MRNHSFFTMLAFSISLWSAQASAVTIFSDDFSPQQPGWDFASPSVGFMGELNNNVNVSGVTLTQNVANADPNAKLFFDLLAFRTLDPVNCCTDTFSLIINGTTVYQGAFSSSVNWNEFLNLNGATVTVNTTVGGIWGFTVPHQILAGVNTYTFSYSPLQSLNDEAWGLDNVSIDANGTVPESTSLALMGLGLAGLSFNRRKVKAKHYLITYMSKLLLGAALPFEKMIPA